MLRRPSELQATVHFSVNGKTVPISPDELGLDDEYKVQRQWPMCFKGLAQHGGNKTKLDANMKNAFTLKGPVMYHMFLWLQYVLVASLGRLKNVKEADRGLFPTLTAGEVYEESKRSMVQCGLWDLFKSLPMLENRANFCIWLRLYCWNSTSRLGDLLFCSPRTHPLEASSKLYINTESAQLAYYKESSNVPRYIAFSLDDYEDSLE